MLMIASLLTSSMLSILSEGSSAPATLGPEEFEPNSFWVLNHFGDEVRGYTASGQHIRTISNVAYRPYGIAFGPDGKLYVSSSTGPTDIAAIDNQNSASFFGSDHLSRPKGLAFGAMGQLYVADDVGNAIVEFDANQNYVRSIAPFGMSQPTQIAVGVDGHLYVASHGNSMLLEIDPEIGVIDSVSMSSIYDLTIDAQGNLWVTRFTQGVFVLDDDLSVTASFTTGSWTNSSSTLIGPDHRMWNVRLGVINVNELNGDPHHFLLSSEGISLITGLAIAPTRIRAKLNAKSVGSTGKVSSKENIDIRFTPGSNTVYLSFRDDAADPNDVVSWTNHTLGCFYGYEVASSTSATQYLFRGTQQRLPARQSGADVIYLTLKGTLGTAGDFRAQSAAGTLDLTYPNFLVHGTLK